MLTRIDADGEDITYQRNYASSQMYISEDPTGTVGVRTSRVRRISYSIISVKEPSYTFVTLSTSTSSGPLVLDYADGHLYYVDNNNVAPYLGRKLTTAADAVTNDTAIIFVNLPSKVFGMVMDTRPTQRRVYLSCPGAVGESAADGDLYYVIVDAAVPAYISLRSAIPQFLLHEPTGLALHFPKGYLFWLDKNGTDVAVRACDIGASFQKCWTERVIQSIEGFNMTGTYLPAFVPFFCHTLTFCLESRFLNRLSTVLFLLLLWFKKATLGT
jgi:hypothetical protein